MRKERSQSRMRPRRLRVIRFHCVLLVWRPQTGCVDRATGVVALLPFHVPAVPFAAAGIPPHRSVAAACPCAFTPGQAAQRCALSAPRLLSPLRRRPPGAGRVAFRCGARLARVVRLRKEGWGDPHTPFFAREACRRRCPPQSVIAQVRPLFLMHTVTQGGRRPEAPLSASRPSDVRAAQACPHWGRREIRRVAAISRLRGSFLRLPRFATRLLSCSHSFARYARLRFALRCCIRES